MQKTKIEIRFKSKKDFRNRITQLWQSQKENEIYEFIWPDKETEEEYNKLVSAFTLKLSPTEEYEKNTRS